MNKLNLKKILPGLVSVVIIAGMAAQTLATSVDMAAFVNKEKYTTKFIELEWRIKDIQKSLDRLYKFTCTNLASFAGTRAAYDYPPAWGYQRNYNHSYYFMNELVASVDQAKYLRVNKRYTIQGKNALVNSHTHRFTKEIPASMCKWNPGIEIYPETKIKFLVTRTDYSGADTTGSMTVTMGPFKKFPRYTTAGTSISTGYICEFEEPMITWGFGTVTVQYKSGSRTEPTSGWSSSTAGVTLTSTNRGYSSYSQYPDITGTELAELYEKGYGKTTNVFYWSSNVFTPDLSSSKDIWIRWTYSNTGVASIAAYLPLRNWNLETWNVKE